MKDKYYNETIIKKIKRYEENIFQENFLEIIQNIFTKLDDDEIAIINNETDHIQFLLKSIQNRYKLLVGYYILVIAIINQYDIKKRRKERGFR